jgi:hypothetical protein
MKKQNSFMQKFERLYKEAVEDDNLFGELGDEGVEDITDDYEGGTEGDAEVTEGEVTLTLTADQVSVLRDVLAQLDGEEEGEEEGEEDEFGDIEDLEGDDEQFEEAVESENAPDAESVRNSTKSGKAAKNTGDLDCDSHSKDGEEKQYKFVKREKPQELKYKTTKGS